MKKSLISIAALIALSASAQTVVGTTFGTTNNTAVTSKYTTTITGGSLGLGGNHVVIGGAGKNTAITGNSTTINTTTTNIGTTGGNVTVTGLNTNLNASNTNINGIDTRINSQKTTVSGALVVGATGDQRTGQNGIYQLNSGGTTAARIDRNGTLSIIGTGGTVAAPVFNVDGKSGVLESKADIRTTGKVSAHGIDNNGQKITNVAEGALNATSKDAVNGSQLHTTNATVEANAKTAATATAKVQTNLDTETAARIAGDTNAIAAANGYTNSEIVKAKADANAYADTGDRRTLGQANTYTDTQIGQVRKEVNAVGAVAMAASVVGGVSVAEGKSTAVTAAVGNYGNATAIAVGVTHIVAPNKRVFATISRASGSKTGVGLGASFSF
jgi:hypothetical protein